MPRSQRYFSEPCCSISDFLAVFIPVSLLIAKASFRFLQSTGARFSFVSVSGRCSPGEDAVGATALSLAAQRGHLEVVRQLVEAQNETSKLSVCVCVTPWF